MSRFEAKKHVFKVKKELIKKMDEIYIFLKRLILPTKT
jgi:hypothetical protein